MPAGESNGFEMTCPTGLRAAAGHFFSESTLVVLSSSFPGDTADTWLVFVTNLGDAEADWQGGVTCA